MKKSKVHQRQFLKPVSFILVETFLWMTLATELSYASSQTHLRPISSRQRKVDELKVALDGSNRLVVRPDANFDNLLKARWEELLRAGANEPDPDKRPVAYNPATTDQRRLGPYKVLYLPEKTGAAKWATPLKGQSVRLVEPVDPSVFHFNQKPPEEFLFDVQVGNTIYHVTPNKYPLFPHHVLFTGEQTRPQDPTEADIRNFIFLADRTSLRFLFQSWWGGSTINDFHVQGSFEDLPADNASAEGFPVSPVAKIKSVQIGRLTGYPGSSVTFESPKTESLIQLTSHFIEFLKREGIPYAVSISKNRVTLLLWTRNFKTLRKYQREVAKRKMVATMTGLAVTTNRHAEVYQSLTRTDLEELIALGALSERNSRLLLNRFLSEARGRLKTLRQLRREEETLFPEMQHLRLQGPPLDLSSPWTFISQSGGEARRFIKRLVERGEEPLSKVIRLFRGKAVAKHGIDAARNLGIPVLVIGGFQHEPVMDTLGRDLTYTLQLKHEVDLETGERRTTVGPGPGTGYATAQARYALPNYKGNLIIVPGDAPRVNEEVIGTLQKIHAPPGEKTAAATILTAEFELEKVIGYGRLVKRKDGLVDRIVEQKDIDRMIENGGGQLIHEDPNDEKSKVIDRIMPQQKDPQILSGIPGATIMLKDGSIWTGEMLHHIREWNAGMYAFQAELLFEALEGVTDDNVQEEHYLTDAIQTLVKKGHEVRVANIVDPSNTEKLKEKGAVPGNPNWLKAANTPEELEEIERDIETEESNRSASDGGIRFRLERPEAIYYRFLEKQLGRPQVLTKILKGLDPELSSRDVQELQIKRLHAIADSGENPVEGLWYIWQTTVVLKDGRNIEAVVKILGPWLTPEERLRITHQNFTAYSKVGRVEGVVPKLLFTASIEEEAVDPKGVFLQVLEYIPVEHGLFDEIKLFEKAIRFWRASDSVTKNRYLPGGLYHESGKVHFFRKKDGQIDARILETVWQRNLPSEAALLEELGKDARNPNHLFHAVIMALGKEEGIAFLKQAVRDMDLSSPSAVALTATLEKAPRYADYLVVPEFHLVLTATQDVETAIRTVEARRIPIGAQRKKSTREAIREEATSIQSVIFLAEKLGIGTEGWLPNDPWRSREEGKSYVKIKEEVLNKLFGREGSIDGRERGFVGQDYVPGAFTFSTRHRHPSFEQEVSKIFAYYQWVAESVAGKLTKDSGKRRAFMNFYRSVRGMTDLEGRRIADRLTPEESLKLIYDVARLFFGNGVDDPAVNPFKEANYKVNTLALTLAREKMQELSPLSTENDVREWLFLKVVANVLDLTHEKYAEAYRKYGIGFFRDRIRKAVSSRSFLINDVDNFFTELFHRPRLVSWDLDNNGEAVFDLVLIQKILNEWERSETGEKGKIVVVPKSLSVANDATAEDVEGLLSDPLFAALRRHREEGRFEILKTGPRLQGTDYTRLSEEHADLYEELLEKDGLLVKVGEAQNSTAPRGGRTPDALYLYKAKGVIAERLVGSFDKHLYGGEPHIIHFVPGRLLSHGVSVVTGDYPVITQTQQAFHHSRTLDLPIIEAHLGGTESALSILSNQMQESGKTFAGTAEDLATLYRSPVAAVLLAGGRGKGLESTEERPKPMVEVGGKPAALHFLDVARSMEIPTVVVVGFGADNVRKALGEEDHIFVTQREQKGTAHAVLRASELLKSYEGNLLVAMGDLIGYTEWIIEGLERAHAPPPQNGKRGVAATLSTKILENPRGKGRIVRDSEGNIVGIVEQKDIDWAIQGNRYITVGGIVWSGEQLDAIKEANTGFYLFNNRLLFEVLPQISPSPVSGEFYLTEAISLLAEKGYQIRGVPLLDPKQISGITTGKDISEREAEIQRNRLEGPASIGILYQEFLRKTGEREFHEKFVDPEKGPRIAVLGGGSGPASLTRGLSRYTAHTAHIITVFDSGGSTGTIRQVLDIPAVGDLRNRLVTLLPRDAEGEIVREILNHRLPRFKELGEGREYLSRVVDTLDPHSNLTLEKREFLKNAINHFIQEFPDFPYERANVGNLIFVSEYFRRGRSLLEATRAISKKLGVESGLIFPVTNTNLDLKAEFEDGTVVYDQLAIVQKELEVGPTVKHLSFVKQHTQEETDRPLAAKSAQSAMAAAEMITAGPGSVHSSYLPVLLPKGIVRTLRESGVPKILFVNIGAYPGTIVRDEWLKEGHPAPANVPASQIVRNILEHMQEVDPHPSRNPRDYFDYVVVNSHRPDPKYVPLDVEHMKKMGLEVLMAPLEDPRVPGHHAADQIAKVMMQIYEIESHGYEIRQGQLAKKGNSINARDGGMRKDVWEDVKGAIQAWNQRREYYRRVTLERQLRRQGVRIAGGRWALHFGMVFIGPEVDVSEFRNGTVEVGTKVTGRSKISAGSRLSGYIYDSIIGENVETSGRISRSILGDDVKVQRGKELEDSTVGARTKIIGSSIRQYDIEEDVTILDSNLSMKGKSSFGNGIENSIGIEKEGRRSILSYERVTSKEVEAVLMKSDRTLMEAYRQKARDHAASVTSERGRVGKGTSISHVPMIVNARIGPYAKVENAIELRDFTLLSNQKYPTRVNSGAIVKGVVAQEGVYIGERATVEKAMMLKHSRASDDVKVEDSVIDVHSTMRFGHIVASWPGPFTNKNHPGILIGVRWPGGRGNVGGNHTGSNHITRGPTEEAVYPPLGFIGTETDFIYPLNLEQAIGLIVGAHLTLPPQKITFPFSVLTTPSVSYNPRLNEIIPGGGLWITPYYYARLEYNHTKINREKETDFDTRIFTPEVVDQMVHAKTVLEGKTISGKRRTAHAVYTEEDYAGLGKNILTEENRKKAIEIYDRYIAYYLLKALRSRLEGLVQGSPKHWLEIQKGLGELTDDLEWEHAKTLLKERYGRDLGIWGKSFTMKLLRHLRRLEFHYYDDVFGSKQKDVERGSRIFKDYLEVHTPFGEITAVTALQKERALAFERLQDLRRSLVALPAKNPFQGTEGPSQASDGGIKQGIQLVSLGGHAFKGRTPDEQLPGLERMLEPIAERIGRGETFLIPHGNGPQFGEELLRVELAAEAEEAPLLRSPYILAETQGHMGHMIQLVLENLLKEKGIQRKVVVLLTHVVVDLEDPAFENPTKFIGRGYNKKEAVRLIAEKQWVMKEYEPGIFRRVVPSPTPIEIVELDVIRKLLEHGVTVVAGGGGGIPLYRTKTGKLHNVLSLAVIDKDATSRLLGIGLGATRLIFLTSEAQVKLDFGKPTERPLATLTPEEARHYLTEGQFPAGSMGPKMREAVEFLEQGGEEVLITDGPNFSNALEGEGGTWIRNASKDGGTHTLQKIQTILPNAAPLLYQEIPSRLESVGLGSGV